MAIDAKKPIEDQARALGITHLRATVPGTFKKIAPVLRTLNHIKNYRNRQKRPLVVE